jgi:hypothetical protein
LGAGAKARLTERAVEYALTGAVLRDTPVGRERVALQGAGIPLRKLLK